MTSAKSSSDTENQNKKLIYVALAGSPNAGKSTLLNSLIGQKISIITPRAQTTRDNVKGIAVHGDTQLVFIDTPGIFIPRKKIKLERKIVKTAWQGVRDADAVCLLVDVEKGVHSGVRTIIEDIKKHEYRTVLLLNKVDIVNKDKLLGLTSELSQLYEFEKIFMISAKTGYGVSDVTEYLSSIAGNEEWVYNEDEITDRPLKNIASDITREKLFMLLQNEMPYAIHVETEAWEKLKDGSIKISQTIYVNRDKQKMIVLGKKGSLIKKVGERARIDIAKLCNAKVHLYLFVKIRDNWVDDDTAL